MDKVKIVEVGPRDGLQNEAKILPAETRITLIEKLTGAGIRHLEAGSFVAQKWVPQMAGTDRVFNQLKRLPDVCYAALTPNLKGVEAAVEVKADEVAVFTAASEGFTQRNINCSIAESIERFRPVIAKAKSAAIPVRGYVSCIIACPYDGPTDPVKVLSLVRQLLELGCYQVSLGDTIGVGTPLPTQALLTLLLSEIAETQLAVHFHDTYGQALTNIDRALELGIRTIDSSVAGLGGCPYAQGASGNVATEDVVYMLHGCGMQTGIDLQSLVDTGNWISLHIGHPNHSKVGVALAS